MKFKKKLEKVKFLTFFFKRIQENRFEVQQ